MLFGNDIAVICPKEQWVNLSGAEAKIFWKNKVDVVVADALALHIART